MKTIQFILDSITRMEQLNIPANIEIGTFKVASKGSLINWAGKTGHYDSSVISFQLRFRPDHIQYLLDMGIKMDLNNAVMADLSDKALRFKKGRAAIDQGRYAPYYYKGDPNNHQTGVVENWLTAPATCSAAAIKCLDKYCRDNHRDEVAIDNDHNIQAAGWNKKATYSTYPMMLMSPPVAKAIRKNVADKNKKTLLPIEQRAIAQKKYSN